VVPADNVEQLGDRCAALEASMRRIGLPIERLASAHDLNNALSGFLPPRPRQFGPAVVDVGSSDHLVADSKYVRAVDLGKLPAAIVTDWTSPLF
jgi:hypothetical protein